MDAINKVNEATSLAYESAQTRYRVVGMMLKHEKACIDLARAYARDENKETIRHLLEAEKSAFNDVRDFLIKEFGIKGVKG